MSGLCDNWGSSTDTWKWWEKHYTNTFETGRARDMRSYASEPESMIAMEMMNVYTGEAQFIILNVPRIHL